MNITDSELVQELLGIIHDRSQTWSRYDAAVTEAGKLKDYRQFDNPQSSALPKPLSQTQTPPDEIPAVLWQLKQECETIAQEEKNITEYQQQIEQTQKQFFIVVGIAIAMIAITVLIIILQ